MPDRSADETALAEAATSLLRALDPSWPIPFVQLARRGIRLSWGEDRHLAAGEIATTPKGLPAAGAHARPAGTGKRIETEAATAQHRDAIGSLEALSGRDEEIGYITNWWAAEGSCLELRGPEPHIATIRLGANETWCEACGGAFETLHSRRMPASENEQATPELVVRRDTLCPADHIETCSWCGEALATSLTDEGAAQELEHWTRHPLSGHTTRRDAGDLLALEISGHAPAAVALLAVLAARDLPPPARDHSA